MRKVRHVLQSLSLLLLSAMAAHADTPSAEYIFPAGGQRGAKVSVRIGATFLHGSGELEMRGHGLTASPQIQETETTWFEGPMIFKPASQRKEDYPRDHAGWVQIDKNAKLGHGYWRIRTSQGATASRPFVVGDLPEVVEEEIDGRPQAQRINIPVTANGRIFPREDVDIWAFEAIAGRRYHCSVLAAGIQSPLDSHIQVIAPDGRMIAENDDAEAGSSTITDSALTFQAQESGLYQVKIFDTVFRGLQNFVYRLTINDAPHVEHVFPLGAKRGQPTEFLLLSGADEALPHGLKGTKHPVQGLRPGIIARSRVRLDQQVGQRFISLPTPGGSASRPIKLDISDVPEWTEGQGEVKDQKRVIHSASNDCALNGRILTANEEDVWQWSGQQGKPYTLQLLTHSLGSPLIADVVIEDSQGKVLKQFEADARLPSEGVLKVTADESPYLIRVRGRSYGPLHGYRLRCRQVKPDFQLRLDSDAITAYRGQKASFKVHVDRQGFQGEITLTLKGLPEDVKAEGLTIAAKKKVATVSLTASESARVRPLHLSILGAAEVDGQQVTRTACLSSPHSKADRKDVLVAVSMPTPFALDGLAFETRYGARGTVFRRHFVVQRNGFKGPLELKLADRQIRHLQGITADTLNLPANANEVDFPIRVSPWLEMNRTSRTVVMAVGKVKDEQGVEHTVSFSSGATKDQIVLLTAPCPISIAVSKASYEAVPGQELDVEFRVDRGVLRPAPVTIRLLMAEHVRDVSAAPIQLERTKSSGAIRIQLGAKPGPFNLPLRLQALTSDGKDTVIAETKFELVSP